MLKLLALLSAANFINPTGAQLGLLPTALPPATVFPQTLPAQSVFTAPQASFTGSTGLVAQTFPLATNFQPAVTPFPLASLSLLDFSGIQTILFVHQRYVTPSVENMHDVYHTVNGQGGTRGPGSGASVIVMHRAMIERIQRLGGLNYVIPLLVPGELIPPALSQAGVASSIGPIPNYLTTTGGILPGSNLFVSLNTIDTLDKLGRVMSRIHREWHIQLGGIMAEIQRSITIPLFWSLHKTFDFIVDQWLQTTAGQAWRANNPNHEVFTLQLDPSAYTNAFFATGDNGCGLMGADALCQELDRWDRETAAQVAATTVSRPVFIQPAFAPPVARPAFAPPVRPLPMPRARPFGPRGKRG